MEGRATSTTRYGEITQSGSRIALRLSLTTMRWRRALTVLRKTLRLSRRIEHRRVHGFRRALARPHHELERREIALAGVDGAGEHRFALRGRGGEPARQYQGLAMHDHASGGPQVEMPDPQLLVDRGHQPLHFAPACD